MLQGSGFPSGIGAHNHQGALRTKRPINNFDPPLSRGKPRIELLVGDQLLNMRIRKADEHRILQLRITVSDHHQR